MRPLRLELKGFTAFRQPAELDFTRLDVFAISGPTGSGKSSLLDAMTYALYGRVERVGDRVGQLISQGQPRMAVKLEFEVGRDRYRVTRSTASGRGATKIQVERLSDGGWKQAGEGSDRVREGGKLLERAVGLTYDGFTRSVLLPQGKFAEFLVGEARRRRDILTELLGLSLFKRMAERAGAIGKESSVRAQERALTLDREYADATPQALKEAKRAAREAERREKALAAAAERVMDILARWHDERRWLEELRACADEAKAAAHLARGAAEELATLVERWEEATARVERSVLGARSAGEALERARAALSEAEAMLGPADRLTRAQIAAHSLARSRDERQGKENELSRAAEAALASSEALERAEEELALREEAVSARESAAREAQAALEVARHGDLVAAVATGLKPGDPCPVCGVPLKKLPGRAASGALDRATKAAVSAQEALERARRETMAAERARDATGRAVEAGAAEQRRLAAEIEELGRRMQADVADLEATVGVPIPEDPAAEIDHRLGRLGALVSADREAERAAAEAARTQLLAERERDRVRALVERQRDRLAVDHRALFDRVTRATQGKIGPVRLEPPPEADAGMALVEHAGVVADLLTEYAERVAAEARLQSSIEGRLLQEATDQVGALVAEPAATLEAMAEAVNEACRRATADVATSSQRAEDLAARLEKRKRLADEVARLKDRALVFRKLAQELRADRLIAFLQAEALQVLAAAGSERLQGLSDGRYRLVCRDDEFLVVDMWNGDEERSVRTLSGGETFVASLALALALADQVRSLSVTDRARVDSLFLDEGFGTLDADTLRMVTDAIEQLAGDGRLVGVITHVKELAEQFPRVEVRKDRAGSTLELVP